MARLCLPRAHSLFLNRSSLCAKLRPWFFCALVLLAAVPMAYARVPVHRDPWDKAIALRDKLEAAPPEQRTRERYEEVLNAFRDIYHQRPDATKAPAAVAAVADLLAEKGRVLANKGALIAAIGQYEFLREQYPNSPQYDNALLLEAEICRQDLKDTACAKDKLRQVIAEQPDTSFSEQASLELKGMESPPERSGKTAAKNAQKNAPANAKAQPAPTPAPEVAGETPQVRGKAKTHTPPEDARPDSSQVTVVPVPAPLPAPAEDSSTESREQSAPGRVVMITGMRHWSNPTSTRIAIDLGGKVEYEAARVPDPDRIFFDLHGARLAAGLNGHQVEVVDDGYLKRIRAAQFKANVTRVVLDVTDVSDYSAFLLPNPWRLIIDIHSDKSAGKIAAANGTAATIGPSRPVTAPHGERTTASSAESTIADVAKLSSNSAKVTATAGPTSAPVAAKIPAPAMPVDSAPAGGAPNASTAANAPASPAASSSSNSSNSTSRKKVRSNSASNATDANAIPHAADPTADGERSLVRALGLKVGRIVIDAGHGGHDTGTLGPGGLQEKDVVLDVALRVGKLLHSRLGAEIVYTRDDDTFIPLETRTAIANKAQADLFLSIHGNSSPEPSARGVETYYLNFTSDPGALEVAARENAVSSSSVHQLSDLVRKIALKDKIDESREFAADVDAGLYSGLKTGNPGLKDRGVKKAPFVVLIGAQMPSILAEISFLTNPDDAEELSESSYKQRIAEALDAGVERYLRGLSGTNPVEKAKRSAKIAAKGGEEPDGQ
jgi:N-acetylmuramoyl-L-alanine amidase